MQIFPSEKPDYAPMPLIVLCGLPSSGKTTRAKQLAEYFENSSKTVSIIHDHSFINDKNKVYSGFKPYN